MKITAVDLYEVNVPDRHWAWSDDEFGMPSHRKTHDVVVVLRTDGGVDGYGELSLRGLDRATVATVVEDWIGINPLTQSQVSQETVAAGAVECAVLDIRGKVLGCPVSELLGGAVRDRVAVTLCTGYKTVENTALDAAWGWEQGFRTYKMKCIVGTPHLQERIDYVVDRVEAIHRQLPEMDVRPDIRRRLEEVWAAEELARRLMGHRLDCLESPIITGAHGESFNEWRRLRQRIGFPIAEHTDAARLLSMRSAEAIDYAIIGAPNAVETVRLSAMAEKLGIPSWTQFVGLGINNALGLHVCAAGPSMTRPHDFVGFWAKEDDCVVEEFPIVDGSVEVPTSPGLGITLDSDAVERYLVR